MSESYQALQIPPTAVGKGGLEVLRTAIVDDNVHVTLRPVFRDPVAWGLLLAQVVRNVGRAYAEKNGADAEQVIAQVRKALDEDLQKGPISTTPITRLD
jgi:hypothetical protein